MTVTPSALVPANTAITAVTDLWEPSALFLPNWQKPVSLSTSYRNVIGPSRSNSEQRFMLAQKPRRTQGFELRAYSPEDSERVRALLARMSRARFPSPIWPDITKLTGRSDFAVTAYFGDFKDRRFQVGARVCALLEDSAGISTQFKYATVLALTDTLITLDTDLNETFDVAPTVAYHNSRVHTAVPPTFVDTLPFLQPDTTMPMQFGLSWNSLSQANVVSVQLVNADTGGVVGTPQAIITLGTFHTLDEGKWINTGVFIVKATNASGRYFLRVTVDNNVLEFAESVTMLADVHEGEPIDFTATLNPANPGEIATIHKLDLRSIRLNQYGLAEFHNQGLMTATSIIGPSGAIILSTTSQTPVLLAISTIGWTSDIVADPVTFNINTTIKRGENPGVFALGAVYNPRDSGGISRGWLFPVMECDLELGNIVKSVTDFIMGGSIVLVETPGPSALDPEIAAGTTPAGYDTFDAGDGLAHPILHLPIDWNGVQTGVFRVGKRDRIGITTTIQVFGSNPGATFTLPFVSLDREDAFNILEFFDSRGGRAFPFWLTAPNPPILPIDIPTLNTLIIPQSVVERDWELYKYIGVFDKTTGTRSVNLIVSAIDLLDGTIQIILTDSLPDSNLTRYEFGTAHLVRFDSDGFDEQWITNEAPRVLLDCVELINEATFSITLLELCGPGGGVTWEVNECDLCLGQRCGTNDPIGCCGCAAFGISVESWLWIGQCSCDVESPCAIDGCTIREKCAAFVPFSACTGTEIEFAIPGKPFSWAKLNYLTVQWTWGNFSDSFDCLEGEIDNDCPDFTCNCQSACIGLSSEVHSCQSMTKQQECDGGGACEMKPIFRISTDGNIQRGGPKCDP